MIDSEGLDALSMRKLGAVLGVEAMSLYNHVRNKDDLLVAVRDRIFAEVLAEFEAGVTPDSSWQARALAMGEAYWHTACAHPAAFQLVTTRPVDSRMGMTVLARTVEFFIDAGLSIDDASFAFHVSCGWLFGHISQEHGLMTQLAELASFKREDVPAELAHVVDFRDALLAHSADERFYMGYEILIAGIEARLAAGVTLT